MRTRTSALALALTLWVGAAHASPEPEPEHVIPPGKEAAARELLASVPTDEALRWLGPTIEIDRIKWWLMRGEQARAIVVLVPRELAAQGDALSQSFAIAVAWAPDVEPEPRERELIERATAAIQAGDQGQFYVVRVEGVSEEHPPPYLAVPELAPELVRRRWTLRMGLLALLLACGGAIVLRRER